MDKWFKDILPDKDPYHNRRRDQMRKKGGPEFECLCVVQVQNKCTTYTLQYIRLHLLSRRSLGVNFICTFEWRDR